MKLPGVSQVLRLSETDSTQTAARRWAEEGAPDRALVWADQQTAGRGRMKRKWKSAPGGLYFSLILRPKFPPSRLGELSLMTARAAAEALKSLAGIETAVKPPNDVLASAGGKARKICGILAEASGNSRSVDWVVLGVGINVNNAPRLKGAASLKELTRRSWEPEAVLRRFLEEFRAGYENFPARP